MYRRSWRTVGATALGLGVFLLIVPSLFLGPQFNGVCLGTWWHRILSPFVVQNVGSDQEINQSMIGVLTRLLTKARVGMGRYNVKLHVNFVEWNYKVVIQGLKILSLAMLGLLAWLCRTRTERRDDPRLFGEFSLIVLVMLFVSERSWKHHYVTLLLPFTYLAYRVGVQGLSTAARSILGGALLLSAFLMATTSSEIGKLFAHRQGDDYALAYGMYLWSGMVLFIATAWRVRVEGKIAPSEIGLGAEPSIPRLRGPHDRLALMVRRESRPTLAES